MNILVATASKHGATEGIAKIITETLKANGINTEMKSPDSVDDITAYDAVLLGSGIYAGRWLKPARQFADKHQAELRAMPVWLFSSGPLEKPPYDKNAKFAVIDDVIEKIKPVEHHVFPGKLDPDALNIGEKAIIKIVKASYGDYRTENDIIAWTTGVVEYLEDFIGN